MGQYLPLLAMVVLALGFCVLSYFGSKLLAPKRPSAAKAMPYECGIVPTQEPPERFPVRFYLIAMIFIVFDIEIIFLYPWAVIYRDLGGFGLLEILIFTVFFTYRVIAQDSNCRHFQSFAARAGRCYIFAR